MTGPNRVALIIALGLALAPALVHADETNPAVTACEGKKQGDACATMKLVKPEDGGELERRPEPGVCGPGECCELDYSKGSPPESTCGPCLTCKPGGPAPSADGGAGDGSVEPPRASAGDPPAQTGNEKRGCSIGERPVPALAPLALLLCLAIGRRRR